MEAKIHFFSRTSKVPFKNFQIGGRTWRAETPISPGDLYRFIREGQRIELLGCVPGTEGNPRSERTGKATDFKRYHLDAVKALQAGDKDTYNYYKSYKFPAACWSGVPNRHKSTETFPSTGILNVDIDDREDWKVPDNVADKLATLPYFEAFGRSASGTITGCNNGWANFRIEIPDQIDPSEMALLRMNTGSTMEIYKAYGRLIEAILLQELSIRSGYSDAKRLRYLIYDPGLRLEKATPLRWKELINLWPRYVISTKKNKGGSVATTVAIEGEGEISYLLKRIDDRMEHKGHLRCWDGEKLTLHSGQRHDYYLCFALECYHHGLELDACTALFDQLISPHIENEVREQIEAARTLQWPYDQNFEGFGQMAPALRHVNTPRRQIDLAPGQYLSDVLTLNDLKNTYLIAPTGSGKTRAVADLFGGGERVILLTPLNSLTRSVAHKYGFVPIRSPKKDEHEATGIDWKRPPDKIVCVYASFHRLLRELGKHELTETYNLVIDEAHYFATASAPGFMGRELKLIWEKRKDFASNTLMTGTEVYIHNLELPRLQVNTAAAKKKTFRVVSFDSMQRNRTVTDGYAEYIRKLIETTDDDVPCIVWQNDKVRLRAILAGHFEKDDWAVFIDAHTKQTNPPLWKALSTKGAFPHPIRCLITTAALKEGLDFDSYTGEAHVVLTHHASAEDIQQLSERFRRASTIHIHYLTSDMEVEHSDQIKDPVQIASWIEANTRAKQLGKVNSKHTLRAIGSFSSFVNTMINDAGEQVLDDVSITHIAYRITSHNQRKYFNQFTAALQKFQIELLPIEHLVAPIRPPHVQEAIDSFRDELDYNRNTAFEQTTDDLFASRMNIVEAAMRHARSANFQMVMGEVDAVETIHNWLDRITRDKDVYLALMPEQDRFNKSHQKAVGSRLFVEWLIRQDHCPKEIISTYKKIMAIPEGIYTEREVQQLAHRCVQVLEDIGGMFRPFTISYARTMLRPFLKTRKNRDTYEIEKFVLPQSLTYIAP